MADTAPAAATPSASARNRRRRKQLIVLAAVVAAGLVLFGLWWILFAGRTVETDNAYVGAEVAQVTPLVDGPVSQVLVDETQVVKKGQALVVLDDADARIAVAQAEAALGQAERRVRGYFATDTALAGQAAARRAGVAEADAQLASARADLDRSRTELMRRQALAATGAVSAEELTTARTAVATARAALSAAAARRTGAQADRAAAAGTRAANAALISGGPVSDNPEVAAARARLDAARLALSRTVLRAPMGGVIAKKDVHVGQQVQAGAPVMAVVPIAEAYVDANFKEVQLKKVRIGQPVTLTSDLYGDAVEFHGRVQGLSAGTGAAFSLIPAQNASGNWIKVVQRLPVRIALDRRELARHPLQVGLSMKAKIHLDSDR